MDLVDLIEEKKFLGQDFLTWLCYESEVESLKFTTPDGKDIGILMDYNMTVVCDSDGCNKIAFSGSGTNAHAQTLPETKMALASGKKIQQAGILLIVGDMEFTFKISGSLMEITSLKLPKTEDAGNSDYDNEIEGAVLERIYLIETATQAFDVVFRTFLELRTSPEWSGVLSLASSWMKDHN